MDYLTLLGLALVDSLSAGTLLVPFVLLIVWGQMRTSPYITYLSTIAVSYFAIGVALILGSRQVLAMIDDASSSRAASWVMLAIGALLAAYGILAPNPKKRSADEVLALHAPDDRHSSGTLAMVGLALAAAVVEVATMFPYLAATGIIQSLPFPLPVQLVILALYCLVMVLPAALGGVLVVFFGQRYLGRMRSWIPRLEYETKVTLQYIAALAGLYLVFRNAEQLGIFESMTQIGRS